MRPDVLAESLALSVKGLLEPIVAALEQARATVADLVKANADLKARVDYLEARPAAIGLRYRKTWQPETAYAAGDVVTCAGSGWVCEADTTAKPGESKDWTLFVKRGRDGKDAKP